MPYNHAGWKYMAMMYQDALSDSLTRAIVIPIPLYYKDNTGYIINKDDADYDYPDAVNILKYDEFDFESIKADEIIIQYPYDEYNCASTIPSFFYSRNIKKYADKLVYMPAFKLDYMTDRHMKAKANVKYHAITPAVIYSDEIVLWSENIKENYISEIRALLGDEWAGKVEEKIIVESRYFEQKINNEKTKKTVLVYLSYANFKKNISKAISKLERIREVFLTKSVQVVFYTDYDAAGAINDETKFYERYSEVIDCFKGLGRVVGKEEVEDAINEADAYYGSPGYIMNMCVRRHIPVMQMNVDM